MKTKDKLFILGISVIAYCGSLAILKMSSNLLIALSAAAFMAIISSLIIHLHRKNQKILLTIEEKLRDCRQRVNQIHSYFASQQKKKLDLTVERARLIEFLSSNYEANVEEIYADFLKSDFKVDWQKRKGALIEQGVTAAVSSDFDCESLFLLIRVVQPKLMVETGVRDGASTAHILEAMRLNNSGKLISIDLPNEDHPTPKACLVADHLKSRWQLIIGDSRIELPKLLKKIKSFDMFFHDSSHTYAHMSFEYREAKKYLNSNNGVLCSHDVVTPPFEKNAFLEFVGKQGCNQGIFRNFGIALLGLHNTSSEQQTEPQTLAKEI